ncbi:MAG: M23 family metallopeptidase [Chloroflexota bacterium]|nr:MAG: hypothetical protein DIU68_03365 [Chloroflexota bacterium]
MKKLIVALGLLLALLATGAAVSFAQDTAESPDGSLDALPPGATPAPLPTREPRPAPTSRVSGERMQVELFFQTLPQGDIGLVHVTGDDVIEASAHFIERRIPFYPIENDGFYGLLSVDMEQIPRRYPLEIEAGFEDGATETLSLEVDVVTGPFIAQDVTISPDKGPLLTPDTERAELARLESIFATTTTERYWDETGFQMPILSRLTSPFGAFRTFNNTLNTRHTGWDIRSTLGTPILASAAGKVVYAGMMDIRGNYVVIDHGYGVYSGYAHMSQVHVTRGQTVAKGQVIGVVGNTGRTSGPHFHWEIAVNGEWVDAVRFIERWIP